MTPMQTSLFFPTTRETQPNTVYITLFSQWNVHQNLGQNERLTSRLALTHLSLMRSASQMLPAPYSMLIFLLPAPWLYTSKVNVCCHYYVLDNCSSTNMDHFHSLPVFILTTQYNFWSTLSISWPSDHTFRLKNQQAWHWMSRDLQFNHVSTASIHESIFCNGEDGHHSAIMLELSSPIHVVPKSNGQWRPYGDYRHLSMASKDARYSKISFSQHSRLQQSFILLYHFLQGGLD